MITTSYSQTPSPAGNTALSRWNECPRRERIIESFPANFDPREPTDAMRKGSQFHKALEHFWDPAGDREDTAVLRQAARDHVPLPADKNRLKVELEFRGTFGDLTAALRPRDRGRFDDVWDEAITTKPDLLAAPSIDFASGETIDVLDWKSWGGTKKAATTEFKYGEGGESNWIYGTQFPLMKVMLAVFYGARVRIRVAAFPRKPPFWFVFHYVPLSYRNVLDTLTVLAHGARLRREGRRMHWEEITPSGLGRYRVCATCPVRLQCLER